MQEATGDLWELSSVPNGVPCVTTNGKVRKDGSCVMGRGCALQAAKRYPDLPKRLGLQLHLSGNHVYYFEDPRIITFPVKHAWWEKADTELIARSVSELYQIVSIELDNLFFLPRPGCAN